MKRLFDPATCLKWSWILIVPLAVPLACRTVPMNGTGTPSGPSAAALFKMITQTDPFQQWAQFPSATGTIQSNLPHGPMSRVYINKVVETGMKNFNGQLPDGAIIVKQNMGQSAQVTEAALTVMWKVAGFNPADNDWFWANMSVDGNVVAEGKVAGCISCHGGARTNDFVFLQQF